MLQAITTAGRLNWEDWLLGIGRSFISGGAGAGASALGSVVVDPQHFNIASGGLKHLLALMGISFVIAGLVRLFEFLQKYPVPDKQAQ